MSAPNIETFRLNAPLPAAGLEAVRRGFQDKVETRGSGTEIIYTTTGEYAIQQPPGERWQFTSPEQWRLAQDRQSNQPVYRQDWVTAEELRSRAGENRFEPQQMDHLEENLVREHRITNAGSRLAIADEAELRDLLGDHHIPLGQWPPRALHDLYMYVGPANRSTIDNVSLHEANNELWLASAQTMLANVYYTTADSKTYRLQETEKRYYDSAGISGPLASLTMRSSLGETGQLVEGIPERPFDAAYRCLSEEIGASKKDILQVFSTGSLLRQNHQGHRHFRGLKTEDHTHYFNAWLNPETVRPAGYTCTETDPDGKPRVDIKLGWLEIISSL